jgi:acetylglutamate kinase
VTDAETRDVAIMVLAGRVNKSLVAAIAATGYPAVGVCGGDGMSFRARKKQTPGYDLGFVGEITTIEPRWLEAIWKAGGIPVVCSLALGADGEYYNINADQMAAACAAAAERCDLHRLGFPLRHSSLHRLDHRLRSTYAKTNRSFESYT